MPCRALSTVTVLHHYITSTELFGNYAQNLENVCDTGFEEWKYVLFKKQSIHCKSMYVHVLVCSFHVIVHC